MGARRMRLVGALASAGALTVAGALTLSGALAHGPAPAALEVLAGASSEPGLIRTSVGLAARLPDGSYEYVCPSRWDGNERALSAASDDGLEVLVHSAGLAYHSGDGACSFVPLPGDTVYVTAAARWGGAFLLVGEDYPEDLEPDRSRLWRVEGGVMRELGFEAGAVDGVLAADGRVVVAGAGPRPFAGTLDLEGRLEPAGALPEAPPDALPEALPEAVVNRLTPRARLGETTWLVARDARTARLWRVSTDGPPEVGPPHGVVHGPVRVGARWLAIFDGVLHEHPEGPGGWSAVGEVPWTCLGTLAGQAYACSLEGLFELRDEGAVPSAIPSFSMRQLAPPRDCGGAARVSACRREWAHYGGESGWVDTAPARTPTEPRGPLAAGGCAVGRGAGSWPWALAATTLAVLALAARRRRA